MPGSVRAYVKEKILEKDIHAFSGIKEAYNPENFAQGVNLIGSIRAENGLGQSSRLVAGQLIQCGIKLSIYNVSFDGRLREKDFSYDEYVSKELPYGINLFHVNPCELGTLFVSVPEIWNKRYNIAFWLWELEEFPTEWIKYITLFDEIWTPSEFAGKGLKKVTNIPVKTMPYHITVPFDRMCSRATFGLPENQFLYLVMYDSNSTGGRKNPLGAIEAYKKAFKQDAKDCGIVIKINNARKKDKKILSEILSGYSNVYFITDTLKKEEANSLIKSVDVFISMHRAEGFGLVMAEAMLLGTPVVATNWSANTEFMNEEAACMVKFRLIRNPKREIVYKKGCIWADPDITDAASYLIRLKQDKNFYLKKAEYGKKYIDKKLNKNYIVKLWKQNFQQIML